MRVRKRARQISTSLIWAAIAGFVVAGPPSLDAYAGPQATALSIPTRTASLAADSSDWPQWGGWDPGRNMVSSETNLPESFAPGVPVSTGRVWSGSSTNVRWRARIGTQIYGNPTISGGRVFVGTTGAGGVNFDRPKPRTIPGGRVLCLDEATGKLLWDLSIPKTSKARGKNNFLSQESSAGVCSSPAVDGDRVYVLTGNGFLLCLTTSGLGAGNQGPFRDEARFMAGEDAEPVETLPTDADIVWVFDLIKELKISIHDISSCSVLVRGPYLYLATSNGVNPKHEKCPAPNAPSFIVVDKATGRLVADDGEKLGQRLFHCLWSPPSLGLVNGREIVFFGGGDGVCYAFETPRESGDDGPGRTNAVQILRKVWSYGGNPPEYKTRDGKAINYTDGDTRKKKGNANDGTYVGPSEIIATPVFYSNRVYVALGQDPAHGRGRGLLHCIDATKSGDITQSGRIWAFDRIERSLSGVAIADGRLYVGDVAGHVFCLEADTGRCLWTIELRAESWSTPLVADGKVYIGSRKGLHVLATGSEPRELAQIKLDSPSYGSVVAANGTLFVTSSKNLWAVQKGAVPVH